MQSSLGANRASVRYISLRKPVRSAVRPYHRPMTVASLESAGVEVTSALTAVTASSAALIALANIIRKANGFDATSAPVEDSVSVSPAVVVIPEKEAPLLNAQVAPAQNATNAEEERTTVHSWIASWREKSESTAPADEEEMPIEAGVMPALGAQSAPEPVATPDASALAAVAAQVESARAWVAEWRNKPVPTNDTPVEAISLATPASSVKVTEPTMPQPSPAAAAAILETLTADAPVGSTAPSSPDGSAPVEAPVPALAIADAAAQPLQRVSVPEQYQSKINSLWESYEQKKAREAVLLAQQEKITMDLAALEAVNAAEEETASASGGESNPFVLAIRRVIELFVALWTAIQAAVASLLGGGRPSGASA